MPDRSLGSHRREELSRTLQFLATESPYYRSLLDGSDISAVNSVDILRGLPILRPSEWQQCRSSLRTAPLSDVSLGYTSGTTSSHHAFVVAQDELSAFDDARQATLKTERTMRISRINHGQAAFTGLGPDSIIQPILLPAQLEQAALLLERTQEPFSALEPVRHLQGTLQQIKALTLHLQHRRGRVDDLGVQRITVGRNMLSPRWRKRLEEWWGVEVQVIFGCSELSVCNAALCGSCEYFHLPPSCFGEVVSMDDAERIVEPGGRGALLLTAFFPFVRVEPRIRYRLGDLVELSSAACPIWGDHGFRPLGREQESIRLPESGRWVSSGDFFDCVADFPDVACLPFLTNDATGVEYGEAGGPMMKLTSHPQATLNVELRYDPVVWPDEALRVERDISLGVDTRELAVVAHGPGKLGDAYRL